MTGKAANEIRSFPYHRSLAPMLWVLVGLSCIEMLVVHGLVALWWPRVAIGLSLVSLAGLLWMVRLIRSFRRLPVTVSGDRLTMRTGRLRSIDIPLSAIAGLRGDWSAATLKQQDVLNLGLLAYPNIVVDLAEPIAVQGRSSRQVRAVAHRLDDPEPFRRWIDGLPRRAGLG